MQRLVEETSLRLTVPAGRVPAVVRLQRVLEHVQARGAAAAAAAAAAAVAAAAAAGGQELIFS